MGCFPLTRQPGYHQTMRNADVNPVICSLNWRAQQSGISMKREKSRDFHQLTAFALAVYKPGVLRLGIVPYA